MRRGYDSSPIVVSLVTASARGHTLHPAWPALPRSAPDALHHPRTAIAVATATSFVRGERYGNGLSTLLGRVSRTASQCKANRPHTARWLSLTMRLGDVSSPIVVSLVTPSPEAMPSTLLGLPCPAVRLMRSITLARPLP